MRRVVQVAIERWALRVPFRISRGLRTISELVTVEIDEGGVAGRGECVPNARYGEDVQSVARQIEAIEPALARGLTRGQLLDLLPAGSARCAVDCALWDLEARLGLAPDLQQQFRPLISARTIGIDTPARMASTAAALENAPLVKVKVDGEAPEAQITQVRAALPRAKIIVDANESWTIEQVHRLQPLLVLSGVVLLEQPLPAGTDAALEGFKPLVPICADEACHTAIDVATLGHRYQFVNIKLDKTGGLTEALALADAAGAAGLGIMVGCMVGTSLSIAPALVLAARAAFVDLDGPWLLKDDRKGGVRFTPDGILHPPAPNFWGGAQQAVSTEEF